MQGGVEWQERSLAAVFGASWKRVLQKARRAVVYLDGPMAECLQWNGGIRQLFAAGVSAVQSFHVSAPRHEGAKKALFLLRGPLIGPVRDTLRVLISRSTYEYCVVVCAASAALHRFLKTKGAPVPAHLADAPRKGLNTDIIEEMEMGIMQWMQNPNSTVEIISQPLIAGTRPVDDVALLPTCVGLGLIGDAARILTRHVASSLVHLCASLSPSQPYVFFTPGPISERMSREFIAAAVEEAVWPSVADRKRMGQRGEGLEKRASLILFDRAADLGGVIGHWSDSVAETAFASEAFPHVSGHSSDLAIEMPIFGGQEWTRNTVFPGCLSDILADHPELVSSIFLDTTERCNARLLEKVRSLLRPSDANDDSSDLEDFHDADGEGDWALDDDDVDDSPREKVASGKDEKKQEVEKEVRNIEECVERLSRSASVPEEFAGFLQACMLAVASKKHGSKRPGETEASKMAFISSLEAMLMQMASDVEDQDGQWLQGTDVAEKFLLEIERQLKDRRANGLTLDDFLGLLIFSASVLGDAVASAFASREYDASGRPTSDGGGDRARRGADSGSGSSREGSPCDSAEIEPILIDALWEDKENLPPICSKIVGSTVDEMSVRVAGRKITAKLAWLAAQRRKWAPQFRDVIRSEDPRFPADYSPLLVEMMKAVLHPSKAEVPSLTHRPAEEEGLRDLLKTGLGFLMKSKKTIHPADADVIIVAVLGGLSPLEIRKFRNLVDSKTDKRVVLCGSRLMKPEDVLDELFFAS